MDFTVGQSQEWKEGRRIVDLQELARQMRCKHCKTLLDLSLTVKEMRLGLASVLYIMCQCGLLNDVHTARKQDSDNGRPVYEVNVKASISMFLCGLEVQTMVSLLNTVLEIPIAPPDDSWLVIPVQSSVDIAAASSSSSTVPAVTMPDFNTPAHNMNNGLIPPQLQMMPQHLPHQQHLPQTQSHHQYQQQQQHQPHQLPQQLQQVLNVPQATKESCRVTLQQAVRDKGTATETDKTGGPKCAYYQPCSRHMPTAASPPITPQKNPVEKIKLTKDERDDLKINTKCTVCKIVFRTREHYRMHKILHPQVKKKMRVKCPDCSAEFRDRKKMREHSLIHSRKETDKPFHCELCNKSFFKKSQLRKHVKRCHMKENTHVCTICGKRTFTKSELREHIRIHTGERPYQCEVCDRAFRRKDYLTVHMRQHTGVKPYCCEHCGESFVQKVSLCKHLQTKHSVTLSGHVETNASPSMTNVVPSHTHTLTQAPMVSSMPMLHTPLFYQ